MKKILLLLSLIMMLSMQGCFVGHEGHGRGHHEGHDGGHGGHEGYGGFHDDRH